MFWYPDSFRYSIMFDVVRPGAIRSRIVSRRRPGVIIGFSMRSGRTIAPTPPVPEVRDETVVTAFTATLIANFPREPPFFTRSRNSWLSTTCWPSDFSPWGSSAGPFACFCA